MISVDKGVVRIQEGKDGTTTDVLADVEILLRATREALKDHGFTDPEINAIYLELVRSSSMTLEEVREEDKRLRAINEKENKEDDTDGKY